MAPDQGTSAEAARRESYHAAARAAVAELDEIDEVTLSLEMRLVTLRTRAQVLVSLLDVLGEVAPGAPTREATYAPRPPSGARQGELPTRRRLRERPRDLPDLPVRVGPAGGRPASTGVRAEEILLAPASDGRHVGGARARPDLADAFDPVATDVEAWG